MLISSAIASMFIATSLLPIGLLITGWTVQARVHWIAPDIVSALSPGMSDWTYLWHEINIGYRAHCGRYDC